MTVVAIAALGMVLAACDGTAPKQPYAGRGIVPDFPTAESRGSDSRHDADSPGNDASDAGVAQSRHGQPKHYEMPQAERGTKIISHTGYALAYNAETNCPDWVAWELTRDEANARGGRNPGFYPDPDVDSRHQVSTHDYSGSGYSRGHMCPAADMKWSSEAQHDCFYMTNMCPQNRELNADSWEQLERACRRWARREGSVYIVCGPVYAPQRKVRHIGREHRVRVPDGFFKVVLSLTKGREKAIGFYYANNDRQQTMESAAMSVDQVEELTGYDFFYLVADKLENRVERHADLKAWK